MKKLTVDLEKRSYPIYIGEKIEKLGFYIKKQYSTRKVFVVTNTKVNKLYFNNLKDHLKKDGFEVSSIVISDGEQYKTLETIKDIYTKAFEARLDRHSLLIALGGGVVGDLAGFAAGTYLRGLPFIQVPTTLLSMVDSSVGGKTGFDLAEGKNLIGLFYQPKLVWIDTATLSTLPKRQWCNGLAEVIKYGIIMDNNFFKYLEKNKDVLREDKTAEKIIYRCCQLKAEVVQKDEFEEKGVREILNFGHTFGHAIETLTEYKIYCHGEAVAIGMVMAGELAVKMGIFSQDEQHRIEKIIFDSGLPVSLKEKLPAEKMISSMLRDKKALAGKLRLVLPEKIGKVNVYSDVPVNLICEVLK